MAIETIDNFNIFVGRNIDSRYGPYADETDANNNIDPIFRFEGLTVLLTSSGDQVEYWYYNGVTNSDLKPKGAAVSLSGTDTQVVFFSGSTQISGSPSMSYNYTTNHFFVTGSATFSGSTFIPGVTDTFQNNVVTIDTATGQLYYTASNALAAVSIPLDIKDEGVLVKSGPTFINFTGSGVFATASGTGVDVYIPKTRPGGLNTQIQFNSGSEFSGSGTFTFDYTNNNVVLTGSLLVTQSHISTVDYIDFTKVPVGSEPAHLEGRLHWYDDTKTLQIDTDKNDFMIEVGHQNVVRVYNDTGVDIPLGKVVRINGSQGNQPTVVTASYTDDQSSATTLGFTATLIAGSGGNRHGYVITNGMLRNVNTVGYSVGTQLYLSSSGNFTSTPPDAPLHEVRLGKIIKSNALGIIFVDIMNGYELTELHDVRTTTYSDGDLLVHSSSLWINSKQLTGSYGLTGSLTTSGSITLTGSLYVSGAISASFGANTVGFYGTASWAQSASNALFAQTASFITASNVWGIFGSSSVDSASFASSSISASYAATASFILNPYPINVTGSSLYSVAPVAGIPDIPINNNSIFFGSGAGNQASSASNSNFLGYDAGANTTEAINSNFLGNSAGQLADKANDSNFLGYQAGYSANTASNSNFLGREAGYNSDFTTQSNFIGYQAGYQADNAYNSNFLGYRAGRLIRDAYNSNFIGYEAGSQQSAINTSSYNSNFIGYQVGKNTDNIYNSNFIGYKAGTDADFSPYSNFLGYEAGYSAFSASYSNFIGYQAGYDSDFASHSIFIGYGAGSNAYTASNSTFIGYRAGYQAPNSNNSIFIGYEAGREVNNSSHSIFIGYQAGKELDTGGVDYVGPNNIIIGTNVTLPVSSQNSINIGGLIFATGSNSNTTPVTPTFTPAGGKVGINIYPPLYNFHVSGTVAFPNLTTSSQVNVVVIDTASGQLYYTSSTSVGGGGGGGTPAPSDTYIQYNSGSIFGAEQYFRYLYQSHSLQQGFNVTASSAYSHAEGYTAIAGWKGFEVATLTNGLITIQDNIDYSSEFTSGTILLFNGTYYSTYAYNTIAYSAPDFTIQLDNTGVSLSPAPPVGTSVADTSNLNSSLAYMNNGNYSHAEGQGIAYADYSHAEGIGQALGLSSHAEGNGYAYGNYSHAEGQGVTYGNYSHAEGFGAAGAFSHAEGNSTTAGWFGSTVNSIVNGLITINLGIDFSSEFTGNTIVLRDNSLSKSYLYTYNAINYSAPNFTIQLDDTSINKGSGDTVADISNLFSPLAATRTNYFGHAEGVATAIYGIYSHAGGNNTIALGDSQFVIGAYNEPKNSSSAFIIGDGFNGSNRHNVLFVSKSYFEVSASSVFLQGLPASSELNILVYNSASGQVYYTSSTSVGGGGGGTPAPEDTYIQYNSGSIFGAEQPFRYIYASHSLEQGNNVTASGQYSHAQGYKSEVYGIYSHAEGDNTYVGTNRAYSASFVNNTGSLLSSYGNKASAFSVGEYILWYNGSFKGYTLIESKSYDGSITQVFVDFVSNGQYNILPVRPGVGAHSATGDQIIPVSGAHAEGYQSEALGDYSSAVGNGIAVGAGSQAIGGGLALGDNSQAVGDAYAIGIYSRAEGNSSKAIGNYSHAEGVQTQATSTGAHSEGFRTLASATYSHAEGLSTTASGQYAHAEGNNTIASGLYQTVVGQFNVANTSQSAFIIGDGTSNNNRHNLVFASASSFSIDSKALIGTSSAQALYTTAKITTVAGTNTIYSLQTASYDGAFFDYTLISGLNARAGQIMSIWSDSEIRYTETTTTDIGSTSEFIFSVALTAGSASLQVTGSTGAVIKTIIKGI